MTLDELTKSYEAGHRSGMRMATFAVLEELTAAEGQWHLREDCKVEKRSRSCSMCKLFRKLEKQMKELSRR